MKLINFSVQNRILQFIIKNYGYLQLDRLHPVKYYEHSNPTTSKENLSFHYD